MYPPLSTAASFIPSLLEAIDCQSREPEESEFVLQFFPAETATEPAVTVGVSQV